MAAYYSVEGDKRLRKDDKPNITFVTSNLKKLEELRSILSAGESLLPFEISSKNVDLPELQGATPVSVAIEKCRVASSKIDGPVMTEDTSLCFNGLNGLPGIYIKVLNHSYFILF
jgi:inosine triphosphate pyrophosphatase